MAAKAEYGANPHADINPNDDHGWGGYQWPGGVPSSLLGTATYKGTNSTASCLCRRELVQLFQLVWEIADKKHGYTIYGSPNPSGEPTWGPWGYENRAIGGTSTPSNHSRGKAMDVNAPRNPQSYTFQSDMPPGLVADVEACGFYWGGRYSGGTKYDAMHFEYCYTPDDVAGHVAKAQQILGGSPGKQNTPPAGFTEGDDDMALIVRRDKASGVDYAYDTRNFIWIKDEQHYTLLTATGLITTPHGQAEQVNRDALEWVRGQIEAWGGRIDPMDGQGN